MRGPTIEIITLGFTIMSTLIFILISSMFYYVNVWRIKVESGIAGFKNPGWKLSCINCSIFNCCINNSISHTQVKF